MDLLICPLLKYFKLQTNKITCRFRKGHDKAWKVKFSQARKYLDKFCLASISTYRCYTFFTFCFSVQVASRFGSGYPMGWLLWLQKPPGSCRSMGTNTQLSRPTNHFCFFEPHCLSMSRKYLCIDAHRLNQCRQTDRYIIMGSQR